MPLLRQILCERLLQAEHTCCMSCSRFFKYEPTVAAFSCKCSSCSASITATPAAANPSSCLAKVQRRAWRSCPICNHPLDSSLLPCTTHAHNCATLDTQSTSDNTGRLMDVVRCEDAVRVLFAAGVLEPTRTSGHAGESSRACPHACTQFRQIGTFQERGRGQGGFA